MKSRREFLKLVAAGSAAALTANARGAAAAAKRAATKATVRPVEAKPQAPSAAEIPMAIRAEIEKQKKFTADALKVIREYPLPAGSPMAFSFAPMRVTRPGSR